MKKLILVLLFLPVISFAECDKQFSKVDLCAELTWLKKPVSAKASSFELRFWNKGDKSKKEIDPKKEVNVYSWMLMDSGHHHGGPAFVVKRNENVWHVEKARFFGGMSGSWVVRVEIKENDKVLDTLDFPVEL